MLNIQIKQCRDHLLWYSSRIGEVFKIVKVDHIEDMYWVRTGDAWNTLNFVYSVDCDLLSN
jgi:hypothetical protein